MSFTPRPAQAKILQYAGGTMGVSAVPGSGKTHTLSALAANLVNHLSGLKAADFDGELPEILIVTLSNSAVSNFSSRIAGFLADRGLIPGIGYRIRTLHGMATDIIRGRAEAFGIDPDFVILDENQADALLREAVERWLTQDNLRLFDRYCQADFCENERVQARWADDVTMLARNVISKAKDYQLSPQTLAATIEKRSDPSDFVLLKMVSQIYADYQSLLMAYPAMDFSDLMCKALDILEKDTEYLENLQRRWPVILEDEAQDSSLIQEKVLRLLTGKQPNWVRVGDPNQAIYETFTTADPKFLIDFLSEADHQVDLDNSGRSTASILKLANLLIEWTSNEHPTHSCRQALVKPYIMTTPENDPQRNPKDAPRRIVFEPRRLTSESEVNLVCDLAVRHVRQYPKETIAILAPNNAHGGKFADKLAHQAVDVVELLKGSRDTKLTAKQISGVLSWLSMPMRTTLCQELFVSLYHPNANGDFYLAENDSQAALAVLNQFENLEDFFFPETSEQLAFQPEQNISSMAVQTLNSFRYFLKKWLENRTLRIDQLILLIAQDLFTQADDLSIANQLARIALQKMREDPEGSLNAIGQHLQLAAETTNLYVGLDKVESQFDPSLYRGKIVVTTFHKAKGLEWDQVYLTSCNSYDFPAGSEFEEKGYFENYRALIYYIRDQLDIQSEALEQLRILLSDNPSGPYREGKGTQDAYNAYVSERLRLLFVGITRAKKGLHISWNSGRFEKYSEALAVKILRERYQSN